MPHRSDPQASRHRGADHSDKLERLLSAEEVADFLRVPVNTLYQWRHKGSGPVAFRVGRHLRYEMSSVRAWLDEHVAASK